MVWRSVERVCGIAEVLRFIGLLLGDKGLVVSVTEGVLKARASLVNGSKVLLRLTGVVLKLRMVLLSFSG